MLERLLDCPLRLRNAVQRYDWGSPTAIPELLGITPDGDPYAELWLGAHSSGPSQVLASADGDSDTTGACSVDLADLIRRFPNETLGRRVANEFGPRLPYLLKALAANRALSLQVHPLPHVARAGFNRENTAGLAPSSPERNFHDDQHKPEMVIALTQFTGLAGFRPARTSLRLLQNLPGRVVEEARRDLTADGGANGIRAAFSQFLNARGNPELLADLDETLGAITGKVGAGPDGEAYQTVVDLALQHPGDPGAIASLLLNRFTLPPGGSVYLPAAEIHAYLDGFGIEVMASSDNVLRAGLTSKRVDEAALVHAASFNPRLPVAPTIKTAAYSHSRTTTYRAPVAEFAITFADVQGKGVPLPEMGPRTVLCLDGEMALTAPRGITTLRRGESVFVGHQAGALTAAGDGRLVVAWVP